MPRPIHRPIATAALLLLTLGLAACGAGGARGVADDEYQDYRTKGGDRGKLFGDQGLALGIGKGAGGSKPEEGAGLGVNAYLWRGALDTLAFMPLASADPFGGVIITDWYQPPSSSRRAVQGNGLHPRPPTSGRWGAGGDLPPGRWSAANGRTPPSARQRRARSRTRCWPSARAAAERKWPRTSSNPLRRAVDSRQT